MISLIRRLDGFGCVMYDVIMIDTSAAES